MKVRHWEVFDCFRQKSMPYSNSKHVLEVFGVLGGHPKTYSVVLSSSHGGARYMVSAVYLVIGRLVNFIGKVIVAAATSVKSTNVW